ncbi:MAG: tRNA (guanosine(18)-2'-O)-methyltransferase TrmH [Acidobacteriota bacterium]
MTPRRLGRLNAILDRRQPDLTVLLDDLRKAHNVSAVIRTCDAVGIPEIHAVTDAESFRAKITSSAGSDRYVGVRLHPSHAAAVDALQGEGFRVYAAHLDPDSVDFRELDYTRPTCVVLGQEGPGVAADLLARVDGTLSIPMAGAVESLNVSVAAAVVLFEAQRQRQGAGLYQRPRMPEAYRQRQLFEWGYPRLARWFRHKGYPYPRIGEEGQILDPIPRG